MSTIYAADGTSFTPDSVIKETYIEDIRVTDHPIEDGSTTSDHALKLPGRIVLECLVTESPLSSGRLKLVDGVQRMTDARDVLRGMVGQLLSYQSDRFGLIENMMLEGYPHSVDKKRAYGLTITLKEVKFAVFSSVEIPPEAPAPSAETGAPDGVDTGEQPTETPNDQDAAEDKSWLLDGLEGIGVL